MTETKEWLTPLELEEEYGFSRSTQSKYRMDRKIPFSKQGKFIRYSRSKINQWLEDSAIEMIE
jgi:predicted DNA-binding transcriptional regulator AlpA